MKKKLSSSATISGEALLGTIEAMTVLGQIGKKNTGILFRICKNYSRRRYPRRKYANSSPSRATNGQGA